MPEFYHPQRDQECSHPNCRAPVFMLKNDNTGKPSPIDMEPVQGGNITIDVQAGTYHVLKKIEIAADPDTPRHMNHWVTCPEARAFRERAKEARR